MDESEKWRRYQEVRAEGERASSALKAARERAKRDRQFRGELSAEEQDYNKNLAGFERAYTCCMCGHSSVGPLVIRCSRDFGDEVSTEWLGLSCIAVDWMVPADMNYCAYCLGEFHANGCFMCGSLCGVATSMDRICKRDRDKVLAGRSIKKKTRPGLREHAEAWLWSSKYRLKPQSYYFYFEPPHSYESTQVYLGEAGYPTEVISKLQAGAIAHMEEVRRGTR